MAENENINEHTDSGFGIKSDIQGSRLLNHDGSFNVTKLGIPFLQRFSLYHELINMRWMKFNILVVITYGMINLFFASIYWCIGTEQLTATAPNDFMAAFFFSCQTFTTVGYGFVSPTGPAVALVASFEALTGLMGFALATGVIYGRFSRPLARVIFSDNVLISPYRGGTGLMFRLANVRASEMTDVSAEVSLSLLDPNDPDKKRTFHRLSLEIDRINFLATSWTIVHPIDENSPLKDFDEAKYKKYVGELLISLNGFDDTFHQPLNIRSSYKSEETVWNAKFDKIHDQNVKHKTVVHIDRLSSFTNL